MAFYIIEAVIELDDMGREFVSTKIDGVKLATSQVNWLSAFDRESVVRMLGFYKADMVKYYEGSYLSRWMSDSEYRRGLGLCADTFGEYIKDMMGL